MTITVEAPALGESVSEATVATWLKNEGDVVQEDELIAELETDKINLEVTAPKAGKLIKIMTAAGDSVTPGAAMAEIDESAAGGAPSAPASAPSVAATTSTPAVGNSDQPLSPAVRRLTEENSLNPADIAGTGKDGRILKGDVLAHMENPAPAPVVTAVAGERERREPMSRLRQTIAKRLKEAQNEAAMLTTYNEVDLSTIGKLRKQYQDDFVKRYGVKLGYMSFFTKAVVSALREFPAVNASLDGTDVVYKNYYDIGIAVSTDKGLMVPVVRDADQLNLAGIELKIADLAARGREGKIQPSELQGATFSITNGGVFGSLLNMPILNPPNVGILGMNTIQQRPVVINGEIVVRPMMYIALTYDHRVIDGKEAVGFLKAVKENLEDPARQLVGI